MDDTVAVSVVEGILRTMPHPPSPPGRKMWMDYDEEADVLYVSLDRPQRATDTVLGEEGVLYRYRERRLIGLTILEASTRPGWKAGDAM